MSKIEFTVKALQIPMKVSFKHASAERKVTESLWVEAKRGAFIGLGEGCPRKYVTGETLEGALVWAQSTIVDVSEKVFSLEDLKAYLASHKEGVDANLSAWCAIELSVLDLLAQEAGVSLEKLLGVSQEKSRFQYTAVLSADESEKFQKNVKKYLSYGFYDFKLKVLAKNEEDWKRIDELKQFVAPELRLLWPPVRILASAYAGRSPLSFRLRLDGNNAWAGREDDIYEFLARYEKNSSGNSSMRPWAIEEPFTPKDYVRLSELSVREDMSIILDESLCRLEDVEEASQLPAKWVANMRVSKLGGLLRSLEIVERIKEKNWQVIVGAQVGETSVLSRAALVVARAAGDLLTAQEGAFGTLLLEKDMTRPVVKFGLAGIVFNGASQDKGLGLVKEG